MAKLTLRNGKGEIARAWRLTTSAIDETKPMILVRCLRADGAILRKAVYRTEKTDWSESKIHSTNWTKTGQVLTLQEFQVFSVGKGWTLGEPPTRELLP